MPTLKPGYNHPKIPLFISIGFLLLIIFIQLYAILLLNNGQLVYTLDDAYIHMALAENILSGHYGVNHHEVSAPSSSILWPFIIAPLSKYEVFPFLLNTVAALATVFVFFRIMSIAVSTPDKRWGSILISSLLVLLILVTNLVGLIFTGMEHSLQVLLISVIAYGLIVEIEQGRVRYWLLAAIVIAPLIRYENIAISIAALGYLAMSQYVKKTVVITLLLLALMGGFSVLLISLGLDPFPTSVAAKSAVVESGGKLASIIRNIRYTLVYRQGIILSLGVLGMLSFFLLVDTSIKKKRLALVTIVAVLLHFVAGRYGWYNRYEIYIWTFFLLISLYFFGPAIKSILARKNQNIELIKILVVAFGFAIVTGADYTIDLLDLPIAANNVYEQQYQMHRFATEYYDKPIAVNDLGYVSYKNDHYVLDLWGLASKEALDYRRSSSDSNWMREISRQKDVELAIIYDGWFEQIPDEWIRVGDLHLGKERITPAQSTVSFYVMNPEAYSSTVTELRAFSESLPPGVKFTFAKDND